MVSERNMPEWAAPNALAERSDAQEAAMAFVTEALASGMDPAEVAEMVHDAVVNDTFWIFTDMGMVALLDDKHTSIAENRNPETFDLLN